MAMVEVARQFRVPDSYVLRHGPELGAAGKSAPGVHSDLVRREHDH